MGAIKGIFLVIVSVLLFLSLFATIIFGILSASINYDNVQNKSISIVHDFLQKNGNITSVISQNYPLVKAYCQNNSEYVFSAEGYVFNISCSNVLDGQNKFIDEGIKSLIYRVYYAEYNCNFLDCFKSDEIPVFLISEKMHNSLLQKFRILIALSFVLFILLFLLVQKRPNSFILLGIFFVIPSILFIKMDIFLNSFSNKVVMQFLELFLSQSFSIALKVLIAGIIFIVLGITFKIFNLGFFISNLISKIKSEQIGKQKPTISKKPVKKTSKSKSK